MTRATPDDINRRGEGQYPETRQLTDAEWAEIAARHGFPPIRPQEPDGIDPLTLWTAKAYAVVTLAVVVAWFVGPWVLDLIGRVMG